MELPTNGFLTSFYSANVDCVILQKMFDYIESNHVDVKPERIFSLSEVRQAHEYLEGKSSFGKVVVLT